MPTLDKIKELPNDPFDQFTVPAQPLAVNIKVLGAHTTFELGVVMIGDEGTELSKVTDVVDVAVQPLSLVTVTVYVPGKEILTVASVPRPFDH